ncbi:MAG: choloylglycine hydrolase [Anaeroplasmataceae bacterium]
MCTAATYKTKDSYFGRTLDYEFSYGEEIVIVPRNYTFNYKKIDKVSSHYAIIGMAHVVDNHPLFYDAINEHGLGIAGLNFVGNAIYNDYKENKINIAPYEIIPWILGSSRTVSEAIELINKMNILNIPYSEYLPLAKLHWIISDNSRSITVESVADGIKIYDNKVGILTNNPPFDMQMFALNNYMHLSNKNPNNSFGDIDLKAYSRGLGALGLPGDLSSQSRFIRATFVKLNSKSDDDELSSISQFFHILNSVDQQKGCCDVGEGKYEYTIYTSCCNLNKGIYYYTTYNNHQITAIDMHKRNLDDNKLYCYNLIMNEQIKEIL